MENESEVKEYRWEGGYEKTWEEVKEDEVGNVEWSVKEIIEKSKRLRATRQPNIRLGMMRHLFVIIDCSVSLLEKDLKPTRQMCTYKLLQDFIQDYFDQNPISQLGLITTRNSSAERISELSGNRKYHLEELKKTLGDINYCNGLMSVQNSLEIALSFMKMLPSHTSREILIIGSSLSSCDPGEINTTIESLKSNNIRVSMIHLAAEVRMFRHMCDETKGKHNVIVDDVHFKHVLWSLVEPVPLPNSVDASCVKMGFPQELEQKPPFTTCSCHLAEGGKLNAKGYFCPQCNSKYCELPVECKCCGLILVSSLHLARSLHHLVPIKPFIRIELEEGSSAYCYGCRKRIRIPAENVYICESCKRHYCDGCDIYVHNTLHVCPGCAVKRDEKR